MNQGQISLFLVIGAVLLLIVILLPNLHLLFPGDASSDPANIGLFVEQNTAAALAHCLNQIGLHGGRVDFKDSRKSPIGNFVRGLQNEPTVPALPEMKRELEQCVKQTLLLCIDDFQEAQALGLAVTFEAPSIIALLGKRDTGIDLDIPVSITSGEARQTLDRFAAAQPVRLKTLHQFAERISDNRSSYIRPSDFDLSYLGGLDVDTNIYEYGDSQIYEMRDHGSRLGAGPFVFLSSYSPEE